MTPDNAFKAETQQDQANWDDYVDNFVSIFNNCQVLDFSDYLQDYGQQEKGYPYNNGN